MLYYAGFLLEFFVALRKESVDRNAAVACVVAVLAASLSARRAWIEIPFASSISGPMYVALRKESVDRNMKKGAKNERTQKSLSARRAWIEIDSKSNELQNAVGRSPQGERG